MNKRGQGLSIGTLILIVLGIVVLVLLVLGFSMGWSNLWEKINILGGGNSVSEVVTACNLAVTQNLKYDYCQNFHKVKVDGKTEYLNCQDERVEINLDSKLTCEGDYADRTKSANKYCKELQANDKISTGNTVKINNVVTCSPATAPTQTCAPDAAKCTGLTQDLPNCKDGCMVNDQGTTTDTSDDTCVPKPADCTGTDSQTCPAVANCKWA